MEPKDPVIRYVASCKAYVNTLIGNFDSQHSKAHLTIWDDSNTHPYAMEVYISKIQSKINNFPPVELKLNGFSSFNNEGLKTIFVAIKELNDTDNWFKELYSLLGKPERKPHITVCKSLNDIQYKLLWEVYKNKNYVDSFIPKCLTILMLDAYDAHPRWQEYKKLPFTGGIYSSKLTPICL
ncbi:hypothetical protein [Mucilaginibacter galii]|uniref:hypothetical protein n=1 Tax=Mucilaginibacter galii TaxID=2005073 RepID=UPI00166B6583|nr:hypothetical protein [Mucilaginibacter galii]